MSEEEILCPEYPELLFVILQPFGCLPNHVLVKKLREMYPDSQILSMDYDPDVSFANLENRLQMLIISIKEQQVQKDR